MGGEWAVNGYWKESRAVGGKKGRTRLRWADDGCRIRLEKFRCKELWKKKVAISREESLDYSYKGCSAKEEEEKEKEEKEEEEEEEEEHDDDDDDDDDDDEGERLP
jgi:ABC-type Zn2+ transport system substrate-binding protein/surface adhesin